ncbi:MAG TPA: SDR family oxidoreductase [Dehalococcoidia bacterium]|nr:SDR family oxidoreductase [Dehalococcoidia bacterium]
MDLGLEGKIAIVTGGARGIGAAIVEGFVREGSNVVIADNRLDLAQELAEKVGNGRAKVLAVRTDVTRKSDADNLVSTTLQEFGKIEILVNNAGVVGHFRFVDLEEEEWDRVNDVNAKGVYLVTKAVVPHMIAARYGKIVNISSLAGKRGNAGITHYSASKFAIIGITQSLAKELGEYNINVNAVCPGILPTAMWDILLDARAKLQGVSPEQVWEEWIEQIPLKRAQTPEDIANVVLFLSSEVSKNITGEAISVNGGLRMD